MEMECGDKRGTCRESETSTIRAEDVPGSVCVYMQKKNNYFIIQKKKMVKEHRCNTVGADPRRGGVHDIIILITEF